MNTTAKFIVSLLSLFSSLYCLADTALKRPTLIPENMYAQKFYTNPPSDLLLWSKMLLDLKIPNFSPHVESTYYSDQCNYRNALKTLQELQAQLGKESSYIQLWAINQDYVLSACDHSAKTSQQPVRPAEGNTPLPTRAESDYLYQLGSWYFYHGKYEEALKNYTLVESMPNAPQRPNATYMIVRTLAYLNRAEKAYYKIGEILADDSLKEVHDIARNYRFVIMSNTRSFDLTLTSSLAKDHLEWLVHLIRLNPNRNDSSKEMLQEQQDALEQLRVYFPLFEPDTKSVDWWLNSVEPKGARMNAVKTLSSKYPLIDWMQAKEAYNVFDYDWLWALHRTTHAYWSQNRHIVEHALEKWKESNDGVWLEVAINRVHPKDTLALKILEKAQEYLNQPWQNETAEYRLWLFSLWKNSIRIYLGRGEFEKMTRLITSHKDFYDKNLLSFPESYNYRYRQTSREMISVIEKAFKWMIYTGEIEQARKFLHEIQPQYKNMFHSYEMLLATTYDDAMKISYTAEYRFPSSEGNQDTVWQEMLNILPLNTLASIAQDERVELRYRSLIARTVLTRAILLHYSHEKIDQFAALTAKLNPSLRESLLESVSKHTQESYVELLLKMPRFRPMVYLDYVTPAESYSTSMKLSDDAIDVYNHNDNNWWCRFDEDKLQKRIFNAMRILPQDTQILSFDTRFANSKEPKDNELQPYITYQKKFLSKHPFMMLADSKEIDALQKIPSAPHYLSEQLITQERSFDWIRASEDEKNRHAANLHRAMRVVRYGCFTDGSHETYSKGVYQLLHKRYEQTPWSKATPYWFSDIFKIHTDVKPSQTHINRSHGMLFNNFLHWRPSLDENGSVLQSLQKQSQYFLQNNQ